MPRNPNQGGKGPKVSKQGKSGPIIGSWGLNKGTNKNLNTGKDVKKS